MMSIPRMRPLGLVRSTATCISQSSNPPLEVDGEDVPDSSSQAHSPNTHKSLCPTHLRHESASHQTHKINNRLPLSENPVFGINLPPRISTPPLRSARPSPLHTSSNLNAALLFNPCTFASLAKLSLPCLLFHLVDDEEEEASRVAWPSVDLCAGVNPREKFHSSCKQTRVVRALQIAREPGRDSM